MVSSSSVVSVTVSLTTFPSASYSLTVSLIVRLIICLKLLVLAVIGGAIYVGIEMLWRGHSHPSMFILGGLCFVSIGLINELFPWELGIVWQALIGGTLVTCLEFITGVIVNIWLKLGVWDYSGLPLNIMGQVCLPFYFAWVGLSVVAIVFDDYLRYWFFGEEKPHYKIV